MYEQLYQSIKLRFGSSDAHQSMGDWMCNNTTIKKRPYSFEGYSFQRAIADDMHPNLSVKKCSQVGLTEVQIRKFLAILTRSTAINGIFSMPNEKMFTKTYNSRIKPILEADGVFNPPGVNKPTRSKDTTQIRDSFGYVTSCTEGDATSLSADFLFHDELDLSPQEIIALYQSRVQNSEMKITQSFSTPTFTNFGIDKNYNLTDQREYFCKCSSCGHQQIPRFTKDFIHLDHYPDVENFTDMAPSDIAGMDLENCFVMCEKCHTRLDLGNAELREWVATFPTRTAYRGYQVRPFSTSRIKPDYIFKQLGQYQERNFTRGFFNTVLGEEYSAADAKLQRADIEFCMSKGESNIPNFSKDVGVFLGIDVGFICHITVSVDTDEGFPHFVLFDTVPAAYLEQRVRELMGIYNVIGGAIDRFPETTLANSIRDLSYGTIIPIQYRGQQALGPQFEADTKILSHYSASNTLILDRVQQLVGHRKMIISGYQGQKELVIKHLTDMVRNDKPGEGTEAEWMKTSGEDHYMHAIAFNLLARRVAEHVFSMGLSTTGFTSSFMGAEQGKGQWNLDLGNGSMKSLNRLTRLG